MAVGLVDGVAIPVITKLGMLSLVLSLLSEEQTARHFRALTESQEANPASHPTDGIVCSHCGPHRAIDSPNIQGAKPP